MILKGEMRKEDFPKDFTNHIYLKNQPLFDRERTTLTKAMIDKAIQNNYRLSL